jgi:hypothetical protein
MDRPPLQGPSSETGDTSAHEGIDYKKIAREVLARIDQRLADLERDHPPHSSDAGFHSQIVNDIMNSDRQAALVRMAWRGLIGLLLAASLVAAISLLWSHNETAMQSVTQLVPTPAEKLEPGPPVPAKAMAEVAPVQAEPPPRTAPDDDKPGPASVPPELTELMRKFDRNVADLVEAITELRLARQQEADHNAKTAEDIMAGLDQMTRAMARATMARTPVQATPPKPPAPAPLATAPRTRKPVPIYRLPALGPDGLR